MSLIAELKRRNVIRVGVAYAIVAWFLAQVAEFAFENFGAPEWVLKSVVVVMMLGLPLALILAWAFEMTPEGIKREAEVDRTESITSRTGRKLDRVIIVVLVVALGWFAWDKFIADSEPPSEVVAQESTDSTPQEPSNDAIEDKSVAVLPFIAMSSGPDDEYFADGLTEEILNSLAQLPELLVTARTSAFSFKGQDIPIQEIAAALGVKHIVEGSVRRSGDRLRVTAQLIRADDAFHLWSENYDSTSTDTIAVQEDIAEKIAAALDIVLDERKREAMRQAGLRDVEAFTLYQKARELYERAHGEIATIDGLRQANVLFEQVIELVPDFSNVYVNHSDLYVHILTDDASEVYAATFTREEAATAYATVLADYQAAEQHARSSGYRHLMELDLAVISGNWRALGGRIERALSEPGCRDGNWTSIVSDVFGYAQPFLERSYERLKCDPRRSLSWFNTSRSALRAGNKEEALRVAREGSDIAPGGWLSVGLVRALIANGLHEEALQEIDNRIEDVLIALPFKALVAAHQGDRRQYDHWMAQYAAEENIGDFWTIITSAWGGDRETANQSAARIDQHHFGLMALMQITEWCGCGAPWDLEATPNFAAKIREGGLTWPPQKTMEYPFKDW